MQSCWVWRRRARFKHSRAPHRCRPSGWATSKGNARLPATRDDHIVRGAGHSEGTLITQCRKRHRHQEYLDFLREIDKNVPSKLDVHVVVDNYATHKHPRVKRWLAARPRFHVHFTPRYASWLNQVEIWFNRITQQAIRRGRFRSVKEPFEKIDQYVQNSNRHPHPFVWTATADSIFAKVQRLCEHISGTRH
jgi:transposase